MLDQGSNSKSRLQRKPTIQNMVELSQFFINGKNSGKTLFTPKEVNDFLRSKGCDLSPGTIKKVAEQVGVDLGRKKQMGPAGLYRQFDRTRACAYCIKAIWEELGMEVPKLVQMLTRAQTLEGIQVSDAYPPGKFSGQDDRIPLFSDGKHPSEGIASNK